MSEIMKSDTMADLNETLNIKQANELQDIVDIFKYIEKKYSNNKESQDILNRFNKKVSPLELLNYLTENKGVVYDNIVNFSLKNIGIEIKKYYDLREKQLSDIEQIFYEFERGYKAFSESKTAATELVKIQEFSEQMIENINHLNIVAPSKDLLRMVNYSNFFKSVDSFHDARNINSMQWFQDFISVIENLDNSRKWYGFLNNLYTTLSNYDIQKDINQYADVASELKKQIVQENLKHNETSQLMVNLNNLLNKINMKDSEKEYENIKNIKFNEYKLTSLEKLIEFTLFYKPDVLCNPDPKIRKVVIKAPYIKLSDISNKTYIEFNDIAKKDCVFEPKFIELFALNEVFINVDFNRTSDLEQLSIVAPKWNILQTRKITLDGEPGKAHKDQKARDSNSPGQKGNDGEPGYPGASAGHFVGIGEIFINGQSLTISAVGGEGGPGQNGGDGKGGRDGDTYSDKAKRLSCILPQTWCALSNNCTVSEAGVSSRNEIRNSFIRYYGEHGQEGGNGGDGGRGGQGGNQGMLFLNTFNNYYRVLKYDTTGVAGKNGTAGVGALGGMNGKDIEIQCHIYFETPHVSERRTTIDKGRSSPGSNGTDGGNIQNLENPQTVPIYQPYLAINEFKSYLRENLSGNIRELTFRRFIDLLEYNEKNKQQYDTFAFVDELLQLESQYFVLNKKVSLFPFYESLYNRITEYKNSLNEETLNKYKGILDHLTAAILSKITSYKRNLVGGLIVDTKKKVEKVLEAIKKLKDSNYAVSVNNYEKVYKDIIDEKIKEAELLIKEPIEQAINDNINLIDDQIALYINQVINEERENEEKEEQLLKQQDDLAKSLVLRSFLGIIKMGSQVLSFTGPVGAAVSSAVGGGVMLTESLLLDDSSGLGTDKIPSLPGAIKGSITRIQDEIKIKQQRFKERLDDAEKELEDFLAKDEEKDSPNIVELKESIAKDQTHLKKLISLNKDEFDFERAEELEKLEQKLQTSLEKHKEILEGETKRKNKNAEKQLIRVNVVQGLLNIPEMSLDLYGKIKNHYAKIKQLDDPIIQINNKILQLKQQEKEIYSSLIPTFETMKKDIARVKNDSKNKSHAALDINKWKIRNAIKEVKHQMLKATEGFSVKEDLKYLIDKLDYSMSTMIDVYNRIEEYRSQGEFAAYIKNISSDKNIRFDDVNNNLNYAVDDLGQIMNSNRVLEMYEGVMNTFKQQIFPFADWYLPQYNLPENLKSTDTKSLTLKVETEITAVRDALDDDDIQTNNMLNYIRKSIPFKSNSDEPLASDPFFVWKHATNKEVISRLLEGKEVIMNAHIMGGLKFDAIKFNEIGIRFKLQNETMQDKLHKTLEKFEVTMTHLGNSYYRCRNKFYLMTCREQVLKQSFKKKSNGEPYLYAVSNLLKTKDPLLSPYTMWKIQISPINITATEEFASLTKYKDQEIDLELEGKGQYVILADQLYNVCDNLDKYYSLDDSITEINNVDLNKLQDLSQTNGVSNNRRRNSRNRRRRFLNKYTSIQNIEKNTLPISELPTRSSFINSAVNLISKWFSTGENSINQGSFTKIPELPYESINNQTFTNLNNTVNDSLLYNSNNLLLLDLLIRWKNGVKYTNKTIPNKNRDLAYAQTLAYKKNMPKNIL